MDVEKAVADTIRKYKLMKKSDKVVVALSGGKDSTSVLYILKGLGYDVHGLMIDLHLGEWSRIHKEKMTRFCEENEIALTVVDLKKEIGQGICFVKAVLAKKKGMSGCTVCGVVKRWVLNRWARRLGADVIVTGHNLDDECQNVLMNYLKGNVGLGIRTGPKTGGFGVLGFGVSDVPCKIGDSSSPAISRGSLGGKKNDTRTNADERGQDKLNFVQRVKPLFFVPEGEVRKYAEDKGFDILYDRCPCAFGTYRVDTREWMKENMKDVDKKKVVEGFMEEIAGCGLQDAGKVFRCEECGEVCRGRVCKFCEIVSCV